MVVARGRRWVLLLVPLIAATVSLTAPVPHADANSAEPLVHTPSPMPGTLVQAGVTEIRAWLSSGDVVEHVDLSIDGSPVTDFTLGRQDPGRGTNVAASVGLDPGLHVVRVAFTDAVGQHTERSWSFTSTERSARRLAGASRVETAVSLSQAAFPTAGGASAAVIARADDFADALAGVPLAAFVEGPLLLSARSELPAATAGELRRALAPGSTVHLLGGSAALSDDVRQAVQRLGFLPERHGGSDRFATAAAVAALLPPSPGVVLASGTSFPDALAASAPAARDGLPVLLTAAERLPDATAAAIEDRDPTLVTIVGGTAVVGAGVAGRVGGAVPQVRRVAGPDRYATAVAVLEAFYDRPSAVSLASGAAFPDALAGARHAAQAGQPLVLTHPRALSQAAAEAVRRHRPERFDVYGGSAAVGEQVARAALRAAEDGPDAPRVFRTQPADLDTVSALPAVTVEFDRPVDLAESSLYVEVGGVELHGTAEQHAPGTLSFRAQQGQPAPAVDVAHAAVVAVRTNGQDGRSTHHETAFTYLEPDPVFATAGLVALHLPSTAVEMVAFHEANHSGAQQQSPRDTATPKTTLPSRSRRTGSRTAADVVAAPGSAVLAPVTGRVVRAGSYVLYCDYDDNYAVIEPDSRPGWEVKVLHFHGLRVRTGERVTAGDTILGAGPRQLPFRSQVDAYSHPRNWPHLHVEVVDPSIPTRPGPGC